MTLSLCGVGGWGGVMQSPFRVQPPTTVEVRLLLSWGCDNMDLANSTYISSVALPAHLVKHLFLLNFIGL